MSRPLKGFAFGVAIWLSIVAVSVSSEGNSSSERKNPVPADASSLEAGRRLYTTHCADCHGPRGKGDGKNASDLGKEVPDLTECIDKLSDAKMYEWVSKGRKPMPGFAKELKEDERWHVINFVRSLARKK